MEKPTVETPVTSYREHGAFTVAAVAADQEISGQQQGLENAHLQLKQEKRALEDQEEEVQRRTALFKRKDSDCDDLLRSFELRLYDLVKKDREDPRYRRYFKTGLRAVTEAEPRKTEPTMVAAMVVCLIEDEPSTTLGPLATEFRPRFEAALGAVQTAEQDLSEAEATRLHVRDQNIPAAKATWTDEYVKLHAAIRAHFPRDPARVESYFLRFRKEKKKAIEVENNPVAPAPEPPPVAPPS
ncbi:MAG: hypothetical protein ABI193_15945 [Minicystis sp.]